MNTYSNMRTEESRVIPSNSPSTKETHYLTTSNNLIILSLYIILNLKIFL